MKAWAGMPELANEFEESGDPVPVVLPVGARVERDIAYGRDPEQRMDAYLPRNVVSAAPILFMVHGGAWMLGDKASSRVIANKIAWWLARGFVLASVNYRLVPRTDPAGQVEDVAAALACAQARASSWGADPSRFVVMGHSSGGHLVSLLAADPAISERNGVRPWLGTVALDSAAIDVVSVMSAPHRPFYDRVFGRNPAQWSAVSPYQRLSCCPKPMLLACSATRNDACAQANAFAGRVIAMGGKAAVLPLALTHREINETLGLPGSYTRAMEDFMETLGVSFQ